MASGGADIADAIVESMRRSSETAAATAPHTKPTFSIPGVIANKGTHKATMIPGERLVPNNGVVGVLFDTLTGTKEEIAKVQAACREYGLRAYIDPKALAPSGDTKNYSFERYGKTFSGHWALSPEARARHFIGLVENPAINVIWPFKGSGGASHMLEGVHRVLRSGEFNSERLANFGERLSKIICMGAFSHHADLANWGADKFRATIATTQISHLSDFMFPDPSNENGPKLREVMRPSFEASFGALAGARSIVHFLSSDSKAAKRTPSITGRLVGGNLGVLAANSGTFLGTQCSGNILLLEGMFYKDAHAFHRTIDRLVDHAIRGGVKGIIFGPIRSKSVAPKLMGQLINQILRERDPEGKLPVYVADTVGHFRYNLPLNFGRDAVIMNTKRGPQLHSHFSQELAIQQGRLVAYDKERFTIPFAKLIQEKKRREKTTLSPNKTSGNMNALATDFRRGVRVEHTRSRL